MNAAAPTQSFPRYSDIANWQMKLKVLLLSTLLVFLAFLVAKEAQPRPLIRCWKSA